MRKLKKILAVATFCAATVVGYNAYNNATMTEEERLIKANLEALSGDEDTDRIDCEYLEFESCSYVNVTQYEGTVEYLKDYKKKIGWI
ncbi:MAG: hypothetical protein R3Y26_00560 [Rikenellaceae bacterium]